MKQVTVVTVMMAIAMAALIAACGGAATTAATANAPPATTANAPPATTATPATPANAPPAMAETYGVGVREIDAVDPLTHQTLPVAAFYPSTAPAGATTSIDSYTLAATRDAELAGGRHPLIAISHGHGGSMWGHHDLAEALARRGFIAIVVEHIGDSWRDQSGFGSDRVLLGRAYQVSAAIDRALADPALAAHIDAAKIGVAGFSAGGYTSLLVVGAHPDFTRVPDYCKRHPDDKDICGIQHWAFDLRDPKPTVDPRVRAAFAMAPFAVPFGPNAFDAVTAPVFLAYGTADQLLLPDENARPVLRALHTLAGQRAIEGAGHFVFLAPCEGGMAAHRPDLCVDPPGIDRAAVHAQLADDAARFFAAHL